MKLTTVLVFDDETMEGQVIGQGTQEECERAASACAAISYNGSKTVKSSSLVMMPDDFEIEVGKYWKMES